MDTNKLYLYLRDTYSLDEVSRSLLRNVIDYAERSCSFDKELIEGDIREMIGNALDWCEDDVIAHEPLAIKDVGKRWIGDTRYEVTQSMYIGGTEILLGINMDAEDGNFYLVYTCKSNTLFTEYADGATNDYIKALEDFIGRVGDAATALREKEIDLPLTLITAEQCFRLSSDLSIEGKIVAIKPEVLHPEYRQEQHQLVLVTGGFGANASSRGRAVYCTHLNTGEETRYSRESVLGVMKELPEWARERFEMLQDAKLPEREHVGKYRIIEKIGVGNTIFALGHNPIAVQPYGTWIGNKKSPGIYDWGHYFNSHDAAKLDLQKRAENRQQAIDTPPHGGGR